MNDPWTDGPWEVEGAEEVYGLGIYATERSKTESRAWGYCLAAVELDADARLISLAPEMAEFITRFVTEKGPSGSDKAAIADWLQGCYDEARDLLARARGEA